MLVCFPSSRIHPTVEMFTQVQSRQAQWPCAGGGVQATVIDTSNEFMQRAVEMIGC